VDDHLLQVGMGSTEKGPGQMSIEKLQAVVLTRPHPGRVEIRALPPDPSNPLSGRLLAVADEHGRGWTVLTRPGSHQQILTLDKLINLLFGEER
jgi:hypothetical protein